jgi:hypothetical protein
MFYEDMKKDSQGCIKQVAEFLQVELTEEQFNKVLEKSSFSYMKANDEKFAPPAWDAGHVPMVRSGESGNSKELLSEEAQAQIDAFCLQELDKLSSDFPYRERYVKG